jgi:hypothetical protein
MYPALWVLHGGRFAFPFPGAAPDDGAETRIADTIVMK